MPENVLSPIEGNTATAEMDPVQQAPIPSAAPAAADPNQPIPGRPMPGPDVAAPDAQPGPAKQPSAWSHIAHAMMGKEATYEVNPQTGQTEATYTDRKPGEFWKSIVAGAMTGAFMGSQQKNFVGGVGAGGVGVQQDMERQDARKRQQAETQFKNQQEVAQAGREQQRIDEEKKRTDFEGQRLEMDAKLHAVNIAQANISMFAALHQVKYMDQEQAMQLDQRNRDYQEKMLNFAREGVRQVSADEIPFNGQPGNGRAFLDDFNKKKGEGVYKSDPGTSLVAIPTLNTAGLTYEPKTRTWSDKDGKEVDMQDNATWTVFRMPDAVKNEQISMLGSELKTKYGIQGLEPGSKYPVTMGNLLGMLTEKTKIAAQNASESRAEERLKWQVQHETAATQLNSLRVQYEAAAKEIPPDAAKLKSLEGQMSDATDEMKAAAYTLVHDGKAPPPKPPTPPQVVGQAPTIDLIWGAIKDLPRVELLEHIATAKSLSETQKQELTKRANALVPAKEWLTRPEGKQSPL